MQKDGDPKLKGVKLGMEELYKHAFQCDLPGIESNAKPGQT